jgi:small subunit ribosomal protein S20
LANTPQQRKRVRTAQRQRLENLRFKSSIKTMFRRLKVSVAAGDGEAAAQVATKLASTIDKAAAHKALHKNNAAHKKSRVAHTLAALKS